MSAFDWSKAAETLVGFGGNPITLHVPKTGLSFFDALRLYGAIDLYIGLREDVEIHDEGIRWKVNGHVREQRIAGKPEKTAKVLKKPVQIYDQHWLTTLKDALLGNHDWPTEPQREATQTPLKNPDSVFKDGVRDQSASSYKGLETGYGRPSKIPAADALLAFAGQKRTEKMADIMFLPIFEGRIDLAKVISPLRACLRTPNALYAQALMLLALKTSLFAEGYQDRLTAVVYNTNLASQKGFNYSGVIKIESTAVGKMRSAQLVNHAYHTFRILVSKAWTMRGQSTELTPDALAMAYWLMQPVGKHLTSMITSQERLKAKSYSHLFIEPEYVKEVFTMSYGGWQGDHETVRKFARAVASGIKWARGRDEYGKWLKEEDQRKNWYGEVTMLRSSSSAKAFLERALILIEQGHREHGQIGTAHRNEDFDPKAIQEAIGKDRSDFETFRDLFRMYLVQESTYRGKDETAADAEDESEVSEEEPIEGGVE